MRRPPRSWAWALAAWAISPATAEAGAWVQHSGTAYLRLTTGYLGSDERFDEHGDRVPWDASAGGFRDSEYQDLAVHLYAEIGFAPRWNLVVGVPWSRLQADQPTAVFTTYGVGDVFLAAKRSLWSGDGSVSSVQLGLSFPAGYDETDYPALGSGVTEGSLVGQVGHSWGGPWSNLEAEFRLRGGDYAHQLRGALGGGLSPLPRLALRGEARGALALSGENEGAGSTPGEGDVAAPFDPATADASYLDLAGTLSVAVLRGIALEGEVRSTMLGENTLAGTRWSIALATGPAWRFRDGGR